MSRVHQPSDSVLDHGFRLLFLAPPLGLALLIAALPAGRPGFLGAALLVLTCLTVAAVWCWRRLESSTARSNPATTSCLTPGQTPRLIQLSKDRSERSTAEKALRERLRQADGLQFEQLIALVSAAEGYEVQRLGRPRMDGSVHLRLRRLGRTHVVWCRPVMSPPVDETEVAAFVAELQTSGVSRGVIAAPAGFTEPALDAAYQNVIQCLGEGQILAQLEALRETVHWAQIDGCLASTDHGFQPADSDVAGFAGHEAAICSPAALVGRG